LPSVTGVSIPGELGGWWLFIQIRKENPGDGQRIIKAMGELANTVKIPRWTIVVGEECKLIGADGGFDDPLFHWLANSAPDRDSYLSVCGRRIAFDATPKMLGDERHGLPIRAWPPIIKMSREVSERVKARWSEYFPDQY
jgi:3-polyprenyl-4-hydroxybenzoate decarboxylase